MQVTHILERSKTGTPYGDAVYGCVTFQIKFCRLPFKTMFTLVI